MVTVDVHGKDWEGKGRGIVHNKEKMKEEGEMDLPEHTGSIFIFHKQFFSLSSCIIS